ncbi:hypothetical protein [Rubrimonas cliftonensis]|uniref:Uncharacterized protein n=1 Tax=Rubrimonas cliftonensis TaxID=89524 RepID=A0A1H4EQ53_9RHOB|nr:hypothetical protein [Rubrimonas cliftonensis]SEA86989.1 hypothetical protein SAMN05444370_11527 [Rubrimonas cliftonensis]
MTLMKFRVDPRMAWMIALGAFFAVAIPALLSATTLGGAQFTPVYAGIVALLTGVPGKIGVIVLFAVTMFQVVRGGLGLAGLAFVVALMLANIGAIVDAFFGATLPLAG